jgi:hypothetical protein
MRYQPSQTVRFARCLIYPELNFTLRCVVDGVNPLRFERNGGACDVFCCSAHATHAHPENPALPFQLSEGPVRFLVASRHSSSDERGRQGVTVWRSQTEKKKRADISQREKVHTAQQVWTHIISASHFAKSHPKDARRWSSSYVGRFCLRRTSA